MASAHLVLAVKPALVALLCLAAMPTSAFAQGAQPNQARAQATALVTPVGQLLGPVPLFRVVDGDTIVVMSNIGPRTVRLIGVDAPELATGQPGGREAEAHLVHLLGSGVLLWLELDLGTEDIYGRLLAYVYVPDAGGAWEHAGLRLTQVNLGMLESGWAQPLAIEPNVTYADLFAAAAQAAQAEAQGLWAPAHATASEPAPPTSEPSNTFPIRIHCGLLNPVAENDIGEWVSVILSEPHDTRGYYLFDEGSRSIFRLPTGLQPAGELRVHNPGQGVWNNSGDTVYLMRGGEVIDNWKYEAHEARSGEVVCRSE